LLFKAEQNFVSVVKLSIDLGAKMIIILSLSLSPFLFAGSVQKFERREREREEDS